MFINQKRGKGRKERVAEKGVLTGNFSRLFHIMWYNNKKARRKPVNQGRAEQTCWKKSIFPKPWIRKRQIGENEILINKRKLINKIMKEVKIKKIKYGVNTKAEEILKCLVV